MTSKEIRRIKKTLDILEAGFVKRAQQLFDSSIAEFEPWVEDLFRTKDFENIEVPGRKRYLVLFKRYIQELYVQGMNLADLELEAKRAQFEIQSPPPIIPVDAMNWIDKWTDTFGNDYYGDMTQDVVRTLKSSLEQGLSVKGTMKELSHYLTGPAYNERRLEVIARTNATTAFNQGRLETFRQAGDFVQFVQFLAILDSRTTDICESRHGRMMRLDSPELAANTPPLHYQCRSMLSPVTRFDLRDMEKPGWKDEDGKTFEELLDWKKVATPQKGFGEIGKVIGEKGGSLPQPEDSSKIVTESEKPLKDIEKSGKIKPGKDYADGLGESNIYRADERIDKAVEKVEVEVTIGGKAKIKMVQMGKDETEIDTLTSKWEKHVNPKNFDRIGKVEIINSPLEDLISAMGVRGYYSPEKHDIVLTRYLSLDRKIKVEDMALTSLHEIGHHVYSKILGIEQRNEVSMIYGFLKNNVYDTPPKSEAEWYADCARSYFLKDGKLKQLDAKMAGIADVEKPGFSVSDMLKRQLE